MFAGVFQLVRGVASTRVGISSPQWTSSRCVAVCTFNYLPRRGFAKKNKGNKKKKNQGKKKKKKGSTGEVILTASNLGCSVDGGESQPSWEHILSALVGRRKLFENLNLSFFHGAKIGVLGPNGSGKSTFIKALAGFHGDNYTGEVTLAEGLKIGYLPQEPILNESQTVEQELRSALSEQVETLEELERIGGWIADGSGPIGEPLDELLEEQATLFERAERLEAWDIDRKIATTTQALRCPELSKEVSTLSGGERRRLALSKLLLEEPTMMVLDEPTNHLDAESVSWLESFLQDFSGTVIAVTHDRYFLDNIASWMIELDRGRVFSFEGNYSEWLDQKTSRLDMEHKKDVALAKRLSRELSWIRLHNPLKNLLCPSV